MKYILEIDERERATLILVCGRAWDITERRGGEAPVEWMAHPNDVARRLIYLQSQSSSPAAQQTTRGDVPVASDVPPAPGGRGPDPASDGLDVHELGPITPLSIVRTGEGKKERLTVEWRELQEGGRSTTTKRASCWASNRAIWPRVLEKVKQPVTFLVKEKSGYLSIVGVKS